MTTTRKSAAALALHAARTVGTQAYGAAFDRLDNGHALHALEAVTAAQVGLDVITRQAVAQARADGVTWQSVADALGLNSRQAAEARYGG